MNRPLPKIPRAPARHERRRRGLTLIEAAMVLGLVVIVFAGMAQLLSEASENQRARNTADRMREILAATEKYVNAHLTQLRALGPGGTTTVAITGYNPDGTPGLALAGYLPQGFVDGDAYNQRHAVLVRVFPPPPNGAQNQVAALVTTVPINTRLVIPQRMRGRIARLIGSQGGFCNNPNQPTANVCTTISGSGGGWAVPMNQWNFAAGGIAAGSVQAIVNAGDNAVLSDYLNRNDVGDPAANTMNTTIYSNTQPGQYALQADPNSGKSTLQIGPNLVVPNTVKVGNNPGCNDPTNPGDLVACNDVIGSRFVDRDNPQYLVDPDKSSHLKDMDITDTLVHTTDPTDRLNNNQSVRLRDLLPRYVAQDGFIVSQTNQGVAVPQCAPGGTPRIFLAPMQDSYGFDLNKGVKYTTSPDYMVSLAGQGGQISHYGVTDVTCSAGSASTAGGCTTSSEGFVSDQLVGTRQAVASMNVGSMNVYRQYVADPPVGNQWVVHVNGSDPAIQSNGQPVPWQVLATTYCYY